MNAQQIASELGVHERSVRRWITAGKLPAVRVGRSLQIDIEDARKLSSPHVAEQLDELAELRGLRERYAELEHRYEQLLQILEGGRPAWEPQP